MAHQEACQLFIEQQIEEGLSEGKTPYSIGKDLTGWLERLFEAKIPAKTIEKRAERIRANQNQEFPTNVGSAPNPSSTSEKEGIQEFKSEIKHGGARANAGRPTKNKVTDAFTYIEFARSQVDRIRHDDPERKNAILWLIDYLEALLRKENTK